ncbi:MAG: hypothetical protein OSA11_05235 [Candidatus Nanopelagicales bacterium]|nr:hypothetical protein [Candidatus Nanopelagicales bacterium]
MRNNTRFRSVTVLVGLIGGLISALRLWLGNSDSLNQILWAEDGVFALCVHKVDFLSCTADPFGGYLPLAPRLLAGITGLSPLSAWALVANIVAAAVAGLVVAVAYAILRRGGMGQVVSVLGGLTPVLIPIMGYEVIQTLGSVYIPLLYLSVLAVVFSHGLNRWVVLGLLLFTVLTIPTAVLILPLVLLRWLRRSISLSTFVLWSTGLAAGALVQYLAIASSTKPRPIEMGSEGFATWANSLLPAFMTNVPGFGTGGGSPSVSPSIEQWSLGWLVVAVLATVGAALLLLGWRSRESFTTTVGALLLTGLLFSAFPSIFDGVGNRYFVLPVMLWSLAILVALDGLLVRSRWWVSGIVIAVVLVLWLPQLPAGAFRSTPAPAWSDEVARVSAACKADPALSERIMFTPFWPPNWGDALSEPTHPNVDCLVVWKWLD